MAELHHECGIVAVYHLADRSISPLIPLGDPVRTSRLVPRLLLDIQNRGQLAAGMTSYHPGRTELLATHKDVGSVTEVFSLNQQSTFEKLIAGYHGPAAIGHVRYATCGKDDRNHAQPFERAHIEKSKWFSVAFNGQLANYQTLKQEILSQSDFHLARETDTEVLMHAICRELSGDKRPSFTDWLATLSRQFDGAYNIVYLNAQGEMVVARDALGIRPLCYGVHGSLFAAASESVALSNLGFPADSIKSLDPGTAIIIREGKMSIERFAASPRTAHCFFEWIYFANVASTLDDRSVYLTRKALGEQLAAIETVPIDADTIVVPVPDTGKAAADGMAYRLGVPCLEGLIRNRYVGRTFIEGGNRADKVRTKYTPLAEVLSGKRVLLVEDTIVRSTTMMSLISQLRERGQAREVHVRVACPPIIAPCFYGIDMSTVDELFAPKFLKGGELTPAIEHEMAQALGADSLHYLPRHAIAKSVNKPAGALCQACIDADYPTPEGTRLYEIALQKAKSRAFTGCTTPQRTYEVEPTKEIVATT